MAQNYRSSPDSATDGTVTVDTLKDELSNLATTVQKLASEQFGSTAAQVQQTAATKVSDIEAAIRKSPTQAAAVAVGIGFLVGLMLTR